jgi:hypothetical protein
MIRPSIDRVECGTALEGETRGCFFKRERYELKYKE